jgi:uncharacterized protein YwqG
VAVTLPEVKLARDSLLDGGKPFQWANPEVGFRSKIGGAPDFLQREPIPVCACGAQMSFYGQLDSLSDDFMIGDCGMVYVFVCFDCLETRSIIQFG